MEKKKLKIIIIIFVLLLFITAGTIFFTKDRESSTVELKDAGSLIVEPSELTMDMNNSAQLEAYLQDSLSGEKENITDQVGWSTSSTTVVIVGNKSVKGQVLARDQEAVVEITARYDNQEIEIPVTVTRASLEVMCLPLLVGGDRGIGDEAIKTAQVGSVIRWVSVYKKIGSPNYLYKWTSNDGFYIDDISLVTKKYYTSGVKEVHFWTQDSAGSVAEADCLITITE